MIYLYFLDKNYHSPFSTPARFDIKVAITEKGMHFGLEASTFISINTLCDSKFADSYNPMATLPF